MQRKLQNWDNVTRGRTHRSRIRRARFLEGRYEQPDPSEDRLILSRVPETEPNPRKLTLHDVVDMGLVNQVEPIGIDNTW
jgi:hypothetical protein